LRSRHKKTLRVVSAKVEREEDRRRDRKFQAKIKSVEWIQARHKELDNIKSLLSKIQRAENYTRQVLIPVALNTGSDFSVVNYKTKRSEMLLRQEPPKVKVK
jgi:hypothetical protein